MSNLPVDPYDRTKVMEPNVQNPDRAPLSGTGKDFVVTLSDTTETPGADHMFLSRSGNWVVFGTTNLTSWGNITGDITQQADLMAMFALYTPTDEYARVAFTGNYNDLNNLPPLGTVSPINLNGSTSMFLRGDGNWAIPVDVNAQWGNINGDINAQTDLMALLALKAPLANPIFTGNPQAPTPPVDNNSKSIATTEWFFGQAFNGTPQMDGVASSGNSTLWARGNHRHPSDTTKIGDAPNDGQQYARQSQTWTVVAPPAGGGGGVWIGDTPPSDTTKYPFWWSSASLQLSIWYNDGNSSQWVDTNAEPDTLQGASGPWLLADGTVAAPGLAWASEPGLGWFKYVDSSIGMAAGGHTTRLYDAGYPNYKNTTDYLYAGVANGSSKMLMSNQPFSAVNANYFMLAQNTDGSALIRTTSAGSAAVGNLTLDTPQVLHNDGTVAAPGLAWNSEPGLGWYRLSTSRIGIAAQGAQIFDFLRVSATMTQLAMGPPTGPGISQVLLTNASIGSANSNTLGISVQADGSMGIAGGKSGTATDKGLLMTFPAGVSVAGPLTATGILAVRPASGYAILDLNSPASGVGNAIEGLTNGSLRWQIILGDGAAQSGSNAGADFSIARFSDTGAFLGNSMAASRSTGNVSFSGQVNIGNGLIIGAGGMSVTGGVNIFAGGTNVVAGASLARDGFNYTATSGVFAFYSTGFQPNGGYQMVGGFNFASVGDVDYSQAILQPGVYSELRFSIGGSGNNFAFWNDASAHKSGGSASWIIPSDERLKENIQPYTKGLADLIQLNPVTYTRKPLPTAKANAIPYNHNEIGLTAQQAQVPFPEMVSVDPSFGSDGMLMLDVGPLTFAFINAFKEIRERLAALEALQ